MGSINKQHMTIHWKHIVKDDDSVPSTEATLKEKATLVGRIGQMMLSVGTGAWRVRNSMNEVARTLGISCTANIGLLSIEFTCYEESGTYTHSIALPTTGVNTDKLNALEAFLCGNFRKWQRRSPSSRFIWCWTKFKKAGEL